MTMAAESPSRGECSRAVVTLDLSSATELVSAQQRMRLLSVSRVRVRPLPDGARPPEPAQIDGTDLRTLSFPVNINANAPDNTDSAPAHQMHTTMARMVMALRRGKNRLVLREWKQEACWWNLNMNHEIDSDGGDENSGPQPIRRGGAWPGASGSHDMSGKASQITLSMARAEVAGYRLARFAIDRYKVCDGSALATNSDCGSEVRRSNGDTDGREAGCCIPELLYFSHDDEIISGPMNGCNFGPWALLSYFESGIDGVDADGALQSALIIEASGIKYCETQTENIRVQQSPPRTTEKKPCHHYPTTMVKIRHEFGFDEPHPRHGRVPSDECLDYAAMILRDVILPIQSSFLMLSVGGTRANNDRCQTTGRDNLSSVGWGTDQVPHAANPFQYHDMVAVYRRALHHLSAANGAKGKCKIDERMNNLLHVLGQCIDALGCEWDIQGGKPPPLPPVLCHMDLQPQNLAFAHDSSSNQNAIHTAKGCSVAAVMDWEEACYADPRFELLLVCRKVLASREQADALWKMYSDRTQKLGARLSSQCEKPIRWEVGPLEPWLKLETVHSLCTLLLQAVDLLGGGRSPWETKPDLWGKIDRERQRLAKMGWAFCENT